MTCSFRNSSKSTHGLQFKYDYEKKVAAAMFTCGNHLSRWVVCVAINARKPAGQIHTWTTSCRFSLFPKFVLTVPFAAFIGILTGGRSLVTNCSRKFERMKYAGNSSPSRWSGLCCTSDGCFEDTTCFNVNAVINDFLPKCNVICVICLSAG